MSKKLLKKLLITVGIIDLFIMFLSILYFNNNIIESLYMIFNSIFINFNFIHLTGIVFLFAGFMIDTEQTDSNQNSIKKYIKLRRLGLILFISIISFSFIGSTVGASFMGSDTFGFDALILILIAVCFTPWPIIILLLIIISTAKIKKSKKAEIKRYKELLDAGAITQEEFDTKKKQLLDL